MKTWHFVLLLIGGVVLVFLGFSLFAGDANAGVPIGPGADGRGAQPNPGGMNGTAPGGATASGGIPPALKYVGAVVAPITLLTNVGPIKKAWSSITSIF